MFGFADDARKIQDSKNIAVKQNPGKRPALEDRYSITEIPSMGIFAGVYDGHGGHAVAEIVSKCMAREFYRGLKYWDHVRSALVHAYSMADKLTSEFESGAAAATFFLRGDELVFGNIGDCAIFVCGANPRRLTVPHRPDNRAELKRVINAGALVVDPYVVFRGKGLMLTRSFGNKSMRNVGLNAIPAIGQYRLAPDDEYVMAVSDGVADALSADRINTILSNHSDVETGTDLIIDASLRRGTHDDMTVILARNPSRV